MITNVLFIFIATSNSAKGAPLTATTNEAHEFLAELVSSGQIHNAGGSPFSRYDGSNCTAKFVLQLEKVFTLTFDWSRASVEDSSPYEITIDLGGTGVLNGRAFDRSHHFWFVNKSVAPRALKAMDVLINNCKKSVKF